MGDRLNKGPYKKIATLLEPGEELLAVCYLQSVPSIQKVVVQSLLFGQMIHQNYYLAVTTRRILFFPLSKSFFLLDLKKASSIPLTDVSAEDCFIYIHQQGTPEPLKLEYLTGDSSTARLKKEAFKVILDKQKFING